VLCLGVLHVTTPPEKKEKKLCRNEHAYMHALEVDKEKKTVAAAGHESTTYKQTNRPAIP
jgi:hypothetical protein